MMSFVYIFPVVFISTLVLILFLVSKMGWVSLAAKYQTKVQFQGKRVGIISASINSANYQNIIILKYNKDGIYLNPVLLFRLFHPPILIPWTEIKEVRDKKFLFYNLKELVIGDPFVAIIIINRKSFSKIEPSPVFQSQKRKL